MATAVASEDVQVSPTTRLGLNARLLAWVKRHPRLAALLVIAL